jgi:DNA topoisomerase-6 subunit B
MPETLEEISSSEFFYRHRDLAGFTNPTRAIYGTVRELVENSLDAAEVHGIRLKLQIKISRPNGEKPAEAREEKLHVHIEDNAGGVPRDKIPTAFGRVLVSSKYRLRQTRGLFGLGGKMALIYGQSTTHEPFTVRSSTGKRNPIVEYMMMVDIEKNAPRILKRRRLQNPSGWHGTIIDLTTRGDWGHAKQKILDYLMNTAIAAPYATIIFEDPDGVQHTFEPAAKDMPRAPTETKPHPSGLDIEALKRLASITKATNLLSFLCNQFQRIGPVTAKKLLQFGGIHPRKDPHKLSREELVQLSNAMNTYTEFKAPDASCLSPIGAEQLEAGIKKQLNPAFVTTITRKPSSYSGFPFVVEAGLAFGGELSPNTAGKIPIIRFANKIPLLFDEGSDVARKAIDEVNWKLYRVDPTMPIVAFTSIVSTRIPFRSAGKEMVADEVEVEREFLNCIRECARQLSRYLSRRQRVAHDKRRLDVYEKYLPKLAEFSTKLAGKTKVPNVAPLLKAAVKYPQGDEEEQDGKKNDADTTEKEKAK